MGDAEMSSEKDVLEYLRNFYKAYIIEKPIPEGLEEWCREYLGRQYLDWTLWKKGFHHEHYYDALCKLYIRDPKKSMLFELRWSDVIVEVDKRSYWH